MKITVTYNEDTDLLEIHASGGVLSISQTETAGLYMILHDILGWRGRLKLLMKRRMFKKVGQ